MYQIFVMGNRFERSKKPRRNEAGVASSSVIQRAVCTHWIYKIYISAALWVNRCTDFAKPPRYRATQYVRGHVLRSRVWKQEYRAGIVMRSPQRIRQKESGRMRGGGRMKLVLAGIRNHVLNFHKRVQGLSSPLQSRERHVAWLFPPFFHLLYSPFFYPQRTLSTVSISRCILLYLLSARGASYSAHSPPICRALNSLHSLRVATRAARYRREILVVRTFDREIARIVEAINRRMRQRLYDDWGVCSVENARRLSRADPNGNAAGFGGLDAFA